MMYILLNLVLLVLIVFSFYNAWKNRGNQKIVKILRYFSDHEAFRKALSTEKAKKHSAADEAKLYALQIWGGVFHQDEELFRDGLENIDMEGLLEKRGGRTKLPGMGESALFWLYLFAPNNLYSRKNMEWMDDLYARLDTIRDELSDQLVVQLGEANRKYYYGLEDQGLSFYEKLLDGDYGDLHYLKELIQYYKDIAAVMATTLYQKQGNTEKAEACQTYVDDFQGIAMGKRWEEEIGLLKPEEEEEAQEAEEPAAEEETPAAADEPAAEKEAPAEEKTPAAEEAPAEEKTAEPAEASAVQETSAGGEEQDPRA